MKSLCITLMFFFCLFKNYAQNENPQAIEAMKKAIGPILNGYTTYSYPTDNYGVGTSCNKKWVPKGIMLADMVESYGLDTILNNSNIWKKVNGYAYYGTGGPLTLNDSINKSYGVGLLLPKILKLLNINLSLGANKTNGVTLTIDSAVLRYLKYDAYKNYVLSGKNISLKKAWEKGKVLVITSDYVLLDYSLEINPSDSFSASISAKLDSITKILPNILTGNDSLGFKISKQESGRFTLKSAHPVIFAVAIKKQKSIETLSQDNSFDNWDIVPPIVINPDDYKK